MHDTLFVNVTVIAKLTKNRYFCKIAGYFGTI